MTEFQNILWISGRIILWIFFQSQIKVINANIYMCKCFFSLYGINNKIDIQFCTNTFDHLISFFSMRMNTISSGSLYYFHIIYQCKQYVGLQVVRKETHKKELVFISTRISYIVVLYQKSFFNFPLIRGPGSQSLTYI